MKLCHDDDRKRRAYVGVAERAGSVFSLTSSMDEVERDECDEGVDGSSQGVGGGVDGSLQAEGGGCCFVLPKCDADAQPLKSKDKRCLVRKALESPRDHPLPISQPSASRICRQRYSPSCQDGHRGSNRLSMPPRQSQRVGSGQRISNDLPSERHDRSSVASARRSILYSEQLQVLY